MHGSFSQCSPNSRLPWRSYLATVSNTSATDICGNGEEKHVHSFLIVETMSFRESFSELQFICDLPFFNASREIEIVFGFVLRVCHRNAFICVGVDSILSWPRYKNMRIVTASASFSWEYHPNLNFLDWAKTAKRK